VKLGAVALLEPITEPVCMQEENDHLGSSNVKNATWRKLNDILIEFCIGHGPRVHDTAGSRGGGAAEVNF
jgi:hypothetical protein